MSGWCTGKGALEKSQVVEESFAVDEDTPTTAVPEDETDTEQSDLVVDVESGCQDTAVDSPEETQERQLQAGPPPPPSDATEKVADEAPHSSSSSCQTASGDAYTDDQDNFSREETLFIFDWDDTVLPSTWVQREGLRLDSASKVSEAQRGRLAEAATTGAATLLAAKRHGTVVLVTNAERGWIELSCQKFLPTLYPMLENVRLVSARTTYEGPSCASPRDWKLHAFAAEIARHYSPGVLRSGLKRKNVFSLGDSVHEREALMTATATLPNCRTKSLKFVERPDISQVCKQHELISANFERMVHHDGHLDLCIRCP